MRSEFKGESDFDIEQRFEKKNGRVENPMSKADKNSWAPYIEVDKERFAKTDGRVLDENPMSKNSWVPYIDVDKERFARADGKVQNFCPNKDGRWEGDTGDSVWYPDRDYIPPPKRDGYNNPDQKTWGEILDKYDIDGIPFKDDEPDFSAISEGTVEIEGFSTDRASNYDKADIELAKQKGCSPEDVKKWREENGYVWHECKDMKTMQLVPHEVHANVPHSGGISETKKL